MVSTKRRTGANAMGRPAGGGREGGFTLVELMLGMVLFSVLVYIAMSLVTTSAGALRRIFSEYSSRKQVLVLLREMAEGTNAYGGYLAAKRLSFRDENGKKVFRIEYPDFDDFEQSRWVEYVLDPEDRGGAINQRYVADEGHVVENKWLLTNVDSFDVCKRREDRYTFRIAIGHKVQGFKNPIVRTTEGQARNMTLPSNGWEDMWQQMMDWCD